MQNNLKMSKNINFKYFFNGKEVEKSSIDWDANITIKTIGDVVFVTTNTEGYLSTRHKKRPGNPQ